LPAKLSIEIGCESILGLGKLSGFSVVSPVRGPGGRNRKQKNQQWQGSSNDSEHDILLQGFKSTPPFMSSNGQRRMHGSHIRRRKSLRTKPVGQNVSLRRYRTNILSTALSFRHFYDWKAGHQRPAD
jgi:hypothetical protein